MKEIFKSKFFRIWCGFIVCYPLLYFLAKSFPSAIMFFIFIAVLLPIEALLIGYFYPIFVEKLNLEPSEKIMFKGMLRYLVYWLPLSWGIGLISLKDLSFYMFFSMLLSFLFFSIEIIIAFFRIKKIKQV